jgi:hypothetical protein
LVFEKNANFRRKLAKIPENFDHNIGPCSAFFPPLAAGLPIFYADSFASVHAISSKVAAIRVTRLVHEKVAQNVAQPIFLLN